MVSKIVHKCTSCNRTRCRFDEHCYRCFVDLFPQHTVTNVHKAKEKMVTEFVRETYAKLNWVFDMRIEGGGLFASKHRPDILVDLKSSVLIIVCQAGCWPQVLTASTSL